MRRVFRCVPRKSCWYLLHNWVLLICTVVIRCNLECFDRRHILPSNVIVTRCRLRKRYKISEGGRPSFDDTHKKTDSTTCRFRDLWHVQKSHQPPLDVFLFPHDPPTSHRRIKCIITQESNHQHPNFMTSGLKHCIANVMKHCNCIQQKLA